MALAPALALARARARPLLLLLAQSPPPTRAAGCSRRAREEQTTAAHPLAPARVPSLASRRAPTLAAEDALGLDHAASFACVPRASKRLSGKGRSRTWCCGARVMATLRRDRRTHPPFPRALGVIRPPPTAKARAFRKRVGLLVRSASPPRLGPPRASESSPRRIDAVLLPVTSRCCCCRCSLHPAPGRRAPRHHHQQQQ